MRSVWREVDVFLELKEGIRRVEERKGDDSVQRSLDLVKPASKVGRW